MKIFLTGDSHLGALRRANGPAGVAAGAGQSDPVTIVALGRGHRMRGAFFADRGDHAEIVDEDFRTRLRRVPPEPGRYDWIGVSGPLNTARVWRSADFTRFVPFPLCSAGKAVMSTNLLRAVVDDDVGKTIEFLEVVRRSAPVFVVDAPWPFRAHAAVAANGADVVQHVHRWYRQHVLTRLATLGIPVVEIDASCVDDAGFMKPMFRNENPRDAYHANAAFGRLMLDRVRARMMTR